MTTTAIANAAITSAQIADGTITDADIAANANISPSKIRSGPGSGLDADTVDGKHASDFAPATGSANYAPATGSTNYAPASGSASYIQNGITAQNASFNVTGSGTVGGNLSVAGQLTVGGKNVANLASKLSQPIDFTPGSAHAIGGSLQAVSSSRTDVPGMSGSFTSTGGPLHISFSTSATPSFLSSDLNAGVEYSIQIDGGADIIVGQINFPAILASGAVSDGLRQYASFFRVIQNIPAGTHTIKIRWRISKGVGNAQVNVNSDDLFQLTIIEGGA